MVMILHTLSPLAASGFGPRPKRRPIGPQCETGARIMISPKGSGARDENNTGINDENSFLKFKSKRSRGTLSSPPSLGLSGFLCMPGHAGDTGKLN